METTFFLKSLSLFHCVPLYVCRLCINFQDLCARLLGMAALRILLLTFISRFVIDFLSIERLRVTSSAHCAESTAWQKTWQLLRICQITTMASKILRPELGISRNYHCLEVKILMSWQVGNCSINMTLFQISSKYISKTH